MSCLTQLLLIPFAKQALKLTKDELGSHAAQCYAHVVGHREKFCLHEPSYFRTITSNRVISRAKKI